MHALLLIDLQEDFLAPPGLAEQRADVVQRVFDWVGWARRRQLPVIEVRTVLPDDESTWALNMREDGQPVVLEGSPGAQRLAEFTFAPDLSISKRRDDAFHGTDLLQQLRDRDIDALVLAGVSTEACLALTAASAYAHDLRVSLAAGAVASADRRAHVRALAWLKEQYRQELTAPADLR